MLGICIHHRLFEIRVSVHQARTRDRTHVVGLLTRETERYFANRTGGPAGVRRRIDLHGRVLRNNAGPFLTYMRHEVPPKN